MKNRCTLMVVITFLWLPTIFAQSTEVFYRALPHIVLGDTQPSALSLELNYQFHQLQGLLTYSVAPKIFVFGAYNQDNSSIVVKDILGGRTERIKNNKGFQIGIGTYSKAKISGFDHFEVVLGLESQYIDTKDNKVEIGVDFIKIFAQLNLTDVYPKSQYTLSLRAAYAKFDIANGLVFIEPSFSHHYPIISNRKLVLISQLGLSVPMTNLIIDVNTPGPSSISEQYLLSGIAKVGVRYQF